MKRLIGGAAAVALMFGVSASAAGASGHHGITRAQAAKQYLADVAPVNAADSAASSKLKGATTMAQVAAAVAPLSALVSKFDTEVLRQRWPRGVGPDIKALVQGDGVLVGDLNALGTANALNESSLEATLSRDNSASQANANIVRTDLGLPAPS